MSPISTSDADYYTAQLRDVESRLQRSVACGSDNDSAYANLRFELKEDLASLRAQINTRAEQVDNMAGYAPLIAWVDRLDGTRRDTYNTFSLARRNI